MASAYGHRREYREWVNPYDVQLTAQVQAYRQQNHDANFEKIQSLIDQYGAMDLAKDEDKMYLYSRLQTITDELNRKGTIKLDSKGVERELEGIVKNSIDENVLNAYQSTQVYRAEQQKLKELEKLGEKGGYHKYNAMEVQEGQSAWLNDGKVGSKYSGTTYTPYVNVQDKYWKKVQEIYKDTEGEFDIPMVGADGKVVPGAMIRKKVKGMSSAEIRNLVENSMTPEEQEQLRIDAKWGMVMGRDPQNVVSLFNSAIDKQISDYQAQLTKIPASQADLQNILKSNINQLRDLKKRSVVSKVETKEDLNKVISMATYLNQNRMFQGLDDAFSKKVLGEKILENPVYWKSQENDRAWERLQLDKDKFAYQKEKDEKDRQAKLKSDSETKKQNGEGGIQPMITNKATDATKVNEVAQEISNKEGELWMKTYQQAQNAFKSLESSGVLTTSDLETAKQAVKSRFPGMDDKTVYYEAVKQLLDKRDYLSPEVTAFKRQYDERMSFIQQSNDVLKRNVELMGSKLTELIYKPDYAPEGTLDNIPSYTTKEAFLQSHKENKLMEMVKNRNLSKDELETAVAFYVSQGDPTKIPSRGDINTFIKLMQEGKSWDDLTDAQKRIFRNKRFGAFQEHFRYGVENNLGKNMLTQGSVGAGAGAVIGAPFGAGIFSWATAGIGAAVGGIAGGISGVGTTIVQSARNLGTSDEPYFEGEFSRGYRDLYGNTVGGYNLTYPTFNTDADRKTAAYSALASVISSVASGQVASSVDGSVERVFDKIMSSGEKDFNIKTFLEGSSVTVSRAADGKNVIFTMGDGSSFTYPVADLRMNANDGSARGEVFNKWLNTGSEVGERVDIKHLTQSVKLNSLENIAKDSNRTQKERDYARSIYGDTIDTDKWSESFKPLVGSNELMIKAIDKIAKGNFGTGRLVTSPANVGGIPVESFRLEKDGKILLDMNVTMETALGSETIAEQLAGGLDSAKKSYYVYLMLEQKLKEGDYQTILNLAQHFN